MQLPLFGSYQTMEISAPEKHGIWFDNEKISSPCTPRKCSFLAWRALNNFLPADDVMIKKGMYLVSKALDNAKLFTFKHWKNDLRLAGVFKVTINIKEGLPRYLCWEEPKLGSVKLNVDGASKSSTGRSGGGGLLRDNNGEALWRFYNVYGIHLALYAELRALVDGPKMCCEKKTLQPTIETDSKLLHDMITTNTTPWHLQALVQYVRRMLQACRASFSKVYREQNMAADHLSNLALERDKNGTFNSSNLPISLKAYIELESKGIGYVW
ncbi:hypothetical protein LIER_04859 [Lithospermum erythrorhizon]|uniref:RNase H type-1 domain-containing protein n=1 Tax=Lithospermum erythrorhizon TaxID=34254 RepID=A0AAV3P308_LITER